MVANAEFGYTPESSVSDFSLRITKKDVARGLGEAAWDHRGQITGAALATTFLLGISPDITFGAPPADPPTDRGVYFNSEALAKFCLVALLPTVPLALLWLHVERRRTEYANNLKLQQDDAASCYEDRHTSPIKRGAVYAVFGATLPLPFLLGKPELENLTLPACSLAAGAGFIVGVFHKRGLPDINQYRDLVERDDDH